jgi:hypothetical protein
MTSAPRTRRCTPGCGRRDPVRTRDPGRGWVQNCHRPSPWRRAPGGPTCFRLPRVVPDGTRNGMRLVRLKNKLGNRSNASAEIEYDDAFG